MPKIRPFRGLRFEPDVVGDLAAAVSPPYDVISPAQQRALIARNPRNVVRLDLPPEELGDEPDDRYRRAARTFAAWRSDGSFRKDPRPSLYVYEQTYVVPGSDVEVRAHQRLDRKSDLPVFILAAFGTLLRQQFSHLQAG